MEPRRACISFADFPLDASLEAPTESAIAILTGTEGPAYRPVGAAIVVREGRVVAGSLSSGCVEEDIALHAMASLETGLGRTIRYGAGSPYIDIRLPCGGALEVTIIPAPRSEVLRQLAALRAGRRAAWVSVSEGGLGCGPQAGARLDLRLVPDIRFHVFGKGPETVAFAELAAAAGYATEVFSPDDETLAALRGRGLGRRRLNRSGGLADVALDRFSAVVLFFHDHEWEPKILAHAAASEAFYIGAQGSHRARARRDAELLRLGVRPERIATMKGPAGLFRGCRDARALAVSVLGEVVRDAAALSDLAQAEGASEARLPAASGRSHGDLEPTAVRALDIAHVCRRSGGA